MAEMQQRQVLKLFDSRKIGRRVLIYINSGQTYSYLHMINAGSLNDARTWLAATDKNGNQPIKENYIKSYSN